MRSEDVPETEIFSLDWSAFSENDRFEIISHHINYVDISRKAVGASGSYIANIRSLMMMMFITLVCIINSAENRTIVLSLIGFQFLKTFLSKMLESGMIETVEVARKNLTDAILKKMDRSKDV